jgi:SNF2 family DNA or RNA helicase
MLTCALVQVAKLLELLGPIIEEGEKVLIFTQYVK